MNFFSGNSSCKTGPVGAAGATSSGCPGTGQTKTDAPRATFKVEACAGRTRVRCNGTLTRSNLIAVIRIYYPQLEDQNIIWDLTAGCLDGLSRSDFEAIAKTVKIHGNDRSDAMTAFVGPSTETYALSCIYVGVSGLADVPANYSVFRTVEDAEQWMSESRAV